MTAGAAMPLWGGSREPPFEPFKSKTHLKCAIARIKQIKAKKKNDAAKMAKEIGQLLKDRKDEMARIKVEHVIRINDTAHAVEILELFCDLLLARHMLIETEVTLPVELQEAAMSICWAASRTEVPDLMECKRQFMLKWREVKFQFAPFNAAQHPPDTPQPNQANHVNQKLQDYLSCATPPRARVIKFLEEIAAVMAPEWTPDPAWAEPENPNLIDLDHGYYSQPLQFEPGSTSPTTSTWVFHQEKLGLSLNGVGLEGGEAYSADAPCAYVMITDVKPTSEFAGKNQIMKGRAIYTVQGRSVMGFSFNATAEAIRTAGRPVSLEIGPPPLLNTAGIPAQVTAPPVAPMAVVAAGPPPGYDAPLPATAAPAGPPGYHGGAPLQGVPVPQESKGSGPGTPAYGGPAPTSAAPAAFEFPDVPQHPPVMPIASPPAPAPEPEFDDLEARMRALRGVPDPSTAAAGASDYTDLEARFNALKNR